MQAKLILGNGREKEFDIPDRDVELLEKSASYGAQVTASEGSNAASKIAYGIIPWGIDLIRQEMKGLYRGELRSAEEDEHE